MKIIRTETILVWLRFRFFLKEGGVRTVFTNVNNLHAGRVLLTAVIAAGAIASFALDWSGNHLLNPLWHPHARFHGALLLFMLAGMSIVSVWLLWRKSSEPEIAIRAAALLSLSFWTPLFYITSVLPGASSWAGDPNADPRLRGSLFTPNIDVAILFVVLNAIALALSIRREVPPLVNR